MSKNVLFNLINNKIFKKGDIPGGAKLSLRTHSEGTDYFFFELPINEMNVEGFTLTNHHLSVFKESSGPIDGKSQYHYTAFIKNKAGHDFRLHIYYNSHDGYVSEPFLSSVSAEGIFTPIADCEEHHPAFKALAQLSINDLVKHLRKTQKDTIKILEGEYDRLETIATGLSVDIEINKIAYLAILDEQIAILEELNSYSNKVHPLSGNLRYLKNFKRVLESETVLSSVRLERKEAKYEKTTAKEESEQLQKSPLSKEVVPAQQVADTILVDGRAVKEKSRLDQDVSVLKEQITQLKSLKGDALVDSVAEFFKKLVELELEVDAGVCNASLKNMHDLRALSTSIHERGVKTLQHLLILGKFTAVAKLSPFYNLLPDTIIDFALTHNKSELLDFLIKNKIVSLDYNNFTIKEKQYTSLVDYYFKQASTTVKAEQLVLVVDCLDVLIKNGMSLMEIDSITGLPYAANLLLDSKHPLREVLERNTALTTNNPMFYKQLNQVLRVIAAQPTFLTARKEQIQQLIDKNKLNTLFLPRKGASQAVSIIDLNKSFYAKAEGKLGKELLDKITTDPDIKKINADLTRRVNLLLPKLPAKVRPMINRGSQENYDKLTKSLDAITSLDMFPTFESFKEQVLAGQRKTSRSIDLLEELIDVQSQIKKITSSYNGKPNRKQRKLLKRQEEIRAELNASQQFAEICSSELFTSVTKALKSLNSLAGKVKGLTSVIEIIISLRDSLRTNSEAGTKKEGKEESNEIDGSDDFLKFALEHEAVSSRVEGKPEVADHSPRAVGLGLTPSFFASSAEVDTATPVPVSECAM